MAVVPKIARPYPPTLFVWVPAFCPVPEHLPLGILYFAEDVFGHRVSVIIRPSPYNGIECFYYSHCRGLLMCVQIGSYCPHMFEDFFLLWDGQQFFSPAPEFPDMESQEVKPFSNVNDSGFSFVQGQSSFFEELYYSWSGVGFQYFPCRGRYHKVIGIADNGYAFIDALAPGGVFGSPICIFCVKQPFHPIQCHMCQQRGDDSSLWRACVCWRGEAECDHSCFQPASQCGGEYGQFGQQWFMVNVIKAAASIRIEHPWTAVLSVQRRMDGLNSVHRAAPWTKAIGVGFKARFPFWLQSRLDDCLHHPVLAGWYAQGSLLPVVFGDIYPSDGSRFIPCKAQALLKQLPAGFWSVVHHSVDACGVFSLVFLGDTSDRQEFVGRGSNKEFLEVFDFPPFFVRSGSVDALLQSSYMRFHPVPTNVSPCVLRMAFGPFSKKFHGLTSPKVRTLQKFTIVRTRRKSAPFRVGYARLCGPVRPITGRRSLFPSSHTLYPIPLPYGRDTTFVGSIGLTQLSMKKSVSGTVGACTPVGLLDVATPRQMRWSYPRTILVMACQPLWPF